MTNAEWGVRSGGFGMGSLKVDEKTWSDFSLSSAMRGMEDEISWYSLEDIKESFHDYETATEQ